MYYFQKGILRVPQGSILYTKKVLNNLVNSPATVLTSKGILKCYNNVRVPQGRFRVLFPNKNNYVKIQYKITRHF